MIRRRARSFPRAYAQSAERGIDNQIFYNRERLRLEHDIGAQRNQRGAADAILAFADEKRGVRTLVNLGNTLGQDRHGRIADKLSIQHRDGFGITRRCLSDGCFKCRHGMS